MTRGGEYPRYTGLDGPNGSKAIYELLAGGVQRLRRYLGSEADAPAERWSCSQVSAEGAIPNGMQFIVAHSLGRGCSGHDYSLLRIALETYGVVRNRGPKLKTDDSLRLHLAVEPSTAAIVLDTSHATAVSLDSGDGHPFVPMLEGQSTLAYCGALPSLPSLRLVLDTAYDMLATAGTEPDKLEGMYRHMLAGLLNDPHYGAALGTRPPTFSA